MKPTVFWHSSENMPEVADRSVKLFMAAGVYLGSKADWPEYAKLYHRVFVEEGTRVLRPDGFMVTLMTDRYHHGTLMPRNANTYGMLSAVGYRLIDKRIWERMTLDFFQPPFTEIWIYVPPGGTHGRKSIKGRAFLDGVWKMKQDNRGKLNSWPRSLCELLVTAFTEPGDLIVDPFAGIARLLGVAAAMGRKTIGYEIDRELEGHVAASFQNQPTINKKPGTLI